MASFLYTQLYTNVMTFAGKRKGNEFGYKVIKTGCTALFRYFVKKIS